MYIGVTHTMFNVIRVSEYTRYVHVRTPFQGMLRYSLHAHKTKTKTNVVYYGLTQGRIIVNSVRFAHHAGITFYL